MDAMRRRVSNRNLNILLWRIHRTFIYETNSKISHLWRIGFGSLFVANSKRGLVQSDHFRGRKSKRADHQRKCSIIDDIQGFSRISCSSEQLFGTHFSELTRVDLVRRFVSGVLCNWCSPACPVLKSPLGEHGGLDSTGWASVRCDSPPRGRPRSQRRHTFYQKFWSRQTALDSCDESRPLAPPTGSGTAPL